MTQRDNVNGRFKILVVNHGGTDFSLSCASRRSDGGTSCYAGHADKNVYATAELLTDDS